MLVLIIIVLYLLTAGILTLIERKFIALVQSRVSNVRLSILGLNQFYIDFIKLIGKVIISCPIKNFKTRYLLIEYVLVNIMIGLLILGLIAMKNYFIIDIISLVAYACVSLTIKIYCSEVMCSYFSKEFMVRVKLVFSFIDSVSFVLDVFYILLLERESLTYYLTVNYKEYCYYVLSSLIVLINSLFKSMRIPLDYLERDSEAVTSLALNVFGIDYALWSLLEYLGIMNSVLYFVYLCFLSINFSLLQAFILYIILLILCCIIRSLFVRGKLEMVISWLIISFSFISFIMFISSIFYFL